MTAMVILLSLPLLAAVALSTPLPSAVRLWIDRAAGGLVLVVALSLIWLPIDEATPLLRADRLGVCAAILVAVAAVAPRSADSPAARHLTLAGMLLAAVSAHPVLMDAALAVATAAALAPRLRPSWYRVPLAGAGFGLLLFGSILPPAPLASGCALLGLATLAAAAPVLLPVLPFLALRFAGPELVALGLASAVGCGIGVLLWPTATVRLPLVAFGQAGAIAVAFGLRAPDATVAGLLLAILLVLNEAARTVAKRTGVVALLAASGSVGLPPFGVFPGLALVILAAARQAPWLLFPLLPALAALGWAVVVRLPSPVFTPSDRWSAAWIPLAIAFLIGWFLPEPVLDWLRALALELPK